VHEKSGTRRDRVVRNIQSEEWRVTRLLQPAATNHPQSSSQRAHLLRHAVNSAAAVAASRRCARLRCTAVAAALLCLIIVIATPASLGLFVGSLFGVLCRRL
jgi:hypothetical protein